MLPGAVISRVVTIAGTSLALCGTVCEHSAARCALSVMDTTSVTVVMVVMMDVSMCVCVVVVVRVIFCVWVWVWICVLVTMAVLVA